jgi:hypothetical protein
MMPSFMGVSVDTASMSVTSTPPVHKLIQCFHSNFSCCSNCAISFFESMHRYEQRGLRDAFV